MFRPKPGMSALIRLLSSSSILFILSLRLAPVTAAEEQPRLQAAGLVAQNGDILTGTYPMPVTIPAGAVVKVDNAVFNNALLVSAQGVIEVLDSATMTVNQPVTNLGTIRLLSRDRSPTLGGIGPIQNNGTFEIVALGGSNGQAVIRVPVAVE